MRKIIILLLLLCMHYSARGQTHYEYSYWFDSDISTAEKGSTTSDAWHMEVDLSRLTESFHTIHLQVTDENNVSSAPVTRCFFLSREGGDLTDGFYWFDNETLVRKVKGNLQGTLVFDVTEFQEGFHTLHYQVKRADGLYSQIETRCFYKMQSDQVVGQLTFMCYIDGVPFKQERVSAENGVATWLLDVSNVPIGFHKLQVRAIMENGSSTTNREAFFLRATMPSELDAMTCICAIDGKVFKQEKMQTTNGSALWQLDVSELPIGFHRLQVRAVMENGASTSIREAFFLRNAMDAELNALACVFSIDGQPYKTVESGVREGVFHCDLDVGALSDGLHNISYILTNGQGAQTTVKSQYFIKQPVGGNSIKKYQYWLNDKDDKAQLVVQDKVTDPLKLITLLPIEPQPLRSSLFHFDLKDGQPMIYAKNEIHLRFFDAAGRFTDASDQFVDYQLGQAVVPVGELQATQTFDKVVENDIRWYTVQAAPGDTLAFRLSQAATMQVFAPSGEEVFQTSEDASVRWAGIHSWENGTYYLAVHDVTGSQPNMTLDYMHMDKYDVVDWDVHTVGNGGCSTITFKGNGFRDLYAVDLYTAEGDTIHSVDVSHDSDAETAVTFDFSGAELGVYDAVFHFTEEDVIVENTISVEEAIDIELATNVSFPSTFSRSATYTVKITNKGNMTAYAVPVYTWIKSQTKDGIYKITYDGLGLDSFMDVINTDSLSSSEILMLQAYSDQLSDDHYFMHFWVKDDNNPNDSIYVRSNYFFANIAPGETKTIRLTIWTREVDTYAYFTVPEDWHTYSLEENATSVKAQARFAKSKAGDWYCCYRERIECVANIVVNGLDIASLFSVPGPTAQNIAACVAGTVNQILTAAGDTYCGANDVQGDFMKKVNNVVKGISIAGVVSSCASAFGVKNASEIGVALDNLLHPSTAVSCIQAFFKPIPGCPPDPPGGGGANGGKSHDPNDIHGYLSEAGSKFITDSVERVNYTIEFENDTTFATLAAHTIVIRDTLDRRYFDLNTFRPTAIKLGERETFLDETTDVKTENGVTSFLTTIDVRPEINAIAQVEGMYSQQTGIAEWRFTSLDPMTMEPTDDLMQGILPVNYDGTSGIGEVMFEVGVKPGKADGTEIPNRAGIVFDYEDAILTPTWVNTVDAVAPSCTILGAIQAKTDTLTLRIAGEDNRSGIWKYEVYARMGEGASWEKVAETFAAEGVNEAEGGDAAEGESETLVDVRIYEGIEYGFLVLATDSAGNVERKSFTEADFEFSTVRRGDANGDGVVDALDVILATSYYLGKDVHLNFAAADVVADGEINSLDIIAMQNIYLGATDGGKALKPRSRRIRDKQQ